MVDTVKEFRLPDLGEGLADADLVVWKVQVGDHLELNQVIAEVETAKATVELPSPYAGTVAELLASPGDTVPVGAPLLRITVAVPAGAESGSRTGEDAVADEEAVAEKRPQVLVGYGPGAAPISRRGTRKTTTPDSETRPPGTLVRRPDAKPGARREAKDLGVDLATVEGTGPDGVITRADVRRSADDRVLPQVSSTGDETRVPIRGIRKRSAAAVARSAFTAPHATVFLTCDATNTVELVTRLRSAPPFDGTHLTPLSVVATALMRAVADEPSLNSSWDEDSQEIVVHHRVHLGVATATDEGLKVPVVRDAHAMRLPDLAGSIAAAAGNARSGEASPRELTGSTISITNVGVFGVDAGTPILNPGEAAILAVGAITDRPWVVDGALAVRKVVTLSLAFDHRLVDGEQAGRALAAVGAVLKDPVPTLVSSP
ncbi:pyruvate dehydrogenase E2 component (dihydrolipoamide acetyltransferase) [Rhodococcus sp. SMB37]|uniref:dihydrolipoamide acetyltransferase family protein n=1 Tax=Rhodococcus sp. SMB37 TaxID=2512213 RepID=UPI00104F527F|nr:dihydrolipoamide acetyltransferase family protein [Rhodococcus sp. SMB37]TCN55708.1 pyruvate dehydrogenase E2 component (dihydrolipoamide acetyltransferase) [Rhodococcus sp. SMB37]